MSNSKRRQRKKHERRRNRARAAVRVLRTVTASERVPGPVPWELFQNPSSYGGCLGRAWWEACPLWWKMLDYRERVASDAETRAAHNARLTPGSKTERW